jgi:hypothetical protein
MAPLTPAGRFTGSLGLDRRLTRQVSLLHVFGLPSIPPPTTLLAPRSFSHATRQLRGLPICIGLGFATFPQARHTTRPNRVHFRCGLDVLLELLPTPSLEDAVTFGYRPESVYLKRTSTSLTKHTCKRTENGDESPYSEKVTASPCGGLTAGICDTYNRPP